MYESCIFASGYVRFLLRRSADRPSAHKKENYKMVVLSLGTVIFSFLPSYKSASPAPQSH